ncbi:MAG: LysR family transcriptional regulator [Myxococcota bacterium]
MHNLRLDDLIVFLAVKRRGTGKGASRTLGINQSTVSRRIAALEEALEVSLFVRTPEGLEVTEAGQRLAVYAEQAEATALDVMRVISGTQTKPEGTVRVAVPTDLCNEIVTPFLVDVCRGHPRLQLDVLTGNRFVDLARGEADLAVRTVRPSQGDLVVKRLVEVTYGVFGAKSFLEAHGLVDRYEDLPWLTWTREMENTPGGRWFSSLGECTVSMRTDSMRVRLNALRAGVGVAVLPHAIAQLEPSLIEVVLPGPPIPSNALWLVSHRAMRRSPRVELVWAALERAFDPRHWRAGNDTHDPSRALRSPTK